MILIDYSQVCMAAIMAFQGEIRKGTPEESKDLIRHVAVSSIKSYKKKYGREFGDVVICCDGMGYWRKEVFAHYKGMRKKSREASDFDWKFIFNTLSEIREDLRTEFPYKVLNVQRCEADDLIAVLTESTQEFGKNEKVMIVSSDKDFKQLHKYENVKQFSPMLKKLVVVNKKELSQWMVEHVVKGDAGDGVPNILSADDTFMSGTRQKPVSAKRLEEFFAKGYDACATDEERRGWKRNATLVDFAFIPEELKDDVMNAYEAPALGDKNSVFNYLVKNKCRVLLDEIDEF